MEFNVPRLDFFETLDPNFDFCNYLRSKGKFILKEVVKEIQELDPDTKITYDILYNRISGWEHQGFIQRYNIATLGGPKYEYSFTKEALKKLDRYTNPD